MRYLDLEHELGHIKQLERFGDEIPPTERWMERSDGRLKKASKLDGIITRGKNSILEYHNRLDEFLRLHERNASRELLEEHIEGINFWAIEYRERGMEKGRSSTNKQWENDFFPDLDNLRARYFEALEKFKKKV